MKRHGSQYIKGIKENDPDRPADIGSLGSLRETDSSCSIESVEPEVQSCAPLISEACVIEPMASDIKKVSVE